MKPGDRLICAWIEPQPVGTTFQEWLLHVTVVPWFRTEISTDAFNRELQAALSNIKPFEAVMAEETRFGYKKCKTVNLVRLPSQFAEIERRIRQLLKKHKAWLVDETTRRQYKYRPHVTAQASRRLQQGDEFGCDSLYIIEQKGDYKEIVAKVKLGYEQTAA